MNNKMNNKYKFLFLLIPAAVIILAFEILPLISIFISSFRDPLAGEVTLGNFKQIFMSPYYVQSISNSIFVSLLSALIGIIISSVGAWAIHSSSGKWRSFFNDVLNITSNFQGVVLAFALILILGNSGVLPGIGNVLAIDWLSNFDLYSVKGVLIAFIYFQIPLGTILLFPAFDAIKTEYKEAASLLNATNGQFWIKVGLPIIFPSIVGTFSLLFANALAAYATPYAIVGNNFALLPIRISNMFTGDVMLQPELGSALSLIMLGIMAIMSLVCNSWARYLRKNS